MYSIQNLIVFIFCCISIFENNIYSQNGRTYTINKYESIYLPLGKISFADSIVNFKMGKPKPFKKFSDPTQALFEPNYSSYSSPSYVSLGCNGSLTLAFTDNGFMNLPGNDLYIFEVGPSKEAAKVEISKNGIDWIFAGNITGGKSVIDLNNEAISTEKVFYYIKITDQKEVCKSKTAGADIDAVGAINSVIKLSINADILFDIDTFQLKSNSHITLDSIATLIQKIDKATILIEGHTDNVGGNNYNMKLSEKRSNAVKVKLTQLLDKNKYDFEITFYGEEKPLVLNNSPENKQLNRRVEIIVLPPKEYYDLIRKN